MFPFSRQDPGKESKTKNFKTIQSETKFETKL